MLHCLRSWIAVVVSISWLAPVQADVLHRGLGPEPDALDIHLAQSLSALNVLRDLHEGLVTLDTDGRLIPGVARTWSVSTDGRVWTFDLDESARWSDGSAIKAHHFVTGW